MAFENLFSSSLPKQYSSLCSKYLTIVGDDFNCVDNPALDYTSYDAHKLNSSKSQNSISFCQTFDLHVVLRITNAPFVC